MANLLIVRGPNSGRQFTLGERPVIIGRDPTVEIPLNSAQVSRRHARISFQGGAFVIEDLGSRNGTLLNDMPVLGQIAFNDKDQLKVGDCVLALVPSSKPPNETGMIVREQVNAVPSNRTLYEGNPEHKLQVVLELSQDLSLTLEQDPLLKKLLDHLLLLFPQADHGVVILCEEDKLLVAAQRSRYKGREDNLSYSRTIISHALKDGVGILSEDVSSDNRFASATIVAMNAQSLLCVPLIAHDARRLGAIQLTCTSQTASFQSEDLRLLTTVGLQVAVVLENVALNAQRLREAQLRKELAMARDIQQSYLPMEFTPLAGGGYQLFAKVFPAREVSGDLYDFFPTGDGRLAFFVGDVSGKGMPAALFMFAVRSLSRHLARSISSPAETLLQLNAALAIDNPSMMFVTIVHGIFHPGTGEIVLATAGHPLPLLRRIDGKVEEFAMPATSLLGIAEETFHPVDARLTLATGETFMLYTDGCTEAFAPDGEAMFGLERLQPVLSNARRDQPLQACADGVRQAIDQFTGTTELQDDLTLLLLRRL